MTNVIYSTNLKMFGGLYFIYNTIKVPHWYNVQGSDTTMIPIAS